MGTFTTVARVVDIPEGKAASFAVNGRMVAVFNDAGNLLAMDDICPHMGASLATGHVEQGVVTCPWHAWRFQLCDGSWCDNPQIKIDSFEVRVEGDEIQVHVPDPEQADPEQADHEQADPEQADHEQARHEQADHEQADHEQARHGQANHALPKTEPSDPDERESL